MVDRTGETEFKGIHAKKLGVVALSLCRCITPEHERGCCLFRFRVSRDAGKLANKRVVQSLFFFTLQADYY